MGSQCITDSNIATLQQDIAKLTESLNQFSGLLSRFLEKENPQQATDVASREAQEEILSIHINDLKFTHRAWSCLYRSGLRTLGELIEITESDLDGIRNLGAKTKMEIFAVLAQFGVRLRKGKTDPVPIPVAPKSISMGIEIKESPHIAVDNARITNLLQNLGYPDCFLEEDAGRWVIEEIRFAMYNPSLAMQAKTYLWPKIAEQEKSTTQEIADLVNWKMKFYSPKWEQLFAHYNDELCLSGEDLAVFTLARKVFEGGTTRCYRRLTKDSIRPAKITRMARYLRQTNCGG